MTVKSTGLRHGKPPHKGARGLPGQDTWLKACWTYKYVALACGRRIGKTTTIKFLVIDEAGEERFQKRPYEACVMSQGHDASKDLYRECLKDWTAAGIVDDHYGGEGQGRNIVLKPYGGNKGSRIWFISGEETAYPGFYGKGLDRAIIDEASQVPSGAWYQCLLPMLLTRKGKAFICGTPYPDGPGYAWFEEFYNRGVIGHETYDAEYCSFAGSSEGNPWNTPEDVAKMRKQYPDEMLARCHIDGIFARDSGAVFSNLKAVFVLPASETQPQTWVHRPPKPGEKTVMGLDLGKHDDYSVASVFSVETSEQLAVMRLRGDYLPQLERVDGLWRAFNQPVIMADARGNETTLELLVRRYGSGAISVKWASGGKWDKESQVVRGQHMFQQAAWRLIKVDWQEEQFRQYMRKVKSELLGGWHYMAPAGRHDDAVTSALYALYQLPYVAEKVVPGRPALEMWSSEWWEALEDSQIRPRLEASPYTLRQRRPF